LQRPVESAQYVSIKYTGAWRRPASNRRSAASAIPTTTRSPKRSNGPYKAEVIHPRGPLQSFEAAELDTLEWVDWFNNRTLLAPIGNIPPAEAEARYYALIEAPHGGAIRNGLRRIRGGSIPSIGAKLRPKQIWDRTLHHPLWITDRLS
jgi:hypothetical protein